MEHYVLPSALLAGGLFLATLVFILELYIPREKQANTVPTSQVKKYNNGTNELEVPVAELEDHMIFRSRKKQVNISPTVQVGEYNVGVNELKITLAQLGNDIDVQ